MLIHIDPDAVRTRVHRKLLVQALPQLEVRCLERLEMGAFNGVSSSRAVVVLVCLEGIAEPALGSWLTAARSANEGLRWFAVQPSEAATPEWVVGLAPEAVLRLPLDVHAIKHHLRTVAKSKNARY